MGVDQPTVAVAGAARRELESWRMKKRFVVTSNLEVVDMT